MPQGNSEALMFAQASQLDMSPTMLVRQCYTQLYHRATKMSHAILTTLSRKYFSSYKPLEVLTRCG